MRQNLIIYILLSAALIGLCLSGCKSPDENSNISTQIVKNPNTAEGKIDKTMLPEFQFNVEEHDFGKVIEGEIVTYAFKFTNVGKADLLISSVSTSCGCTVSKFPKDPIRPGEEGYVEATFNSEGRGGFQNKTITVVANTQPNHRTLRIKAQVVTPESK
jgi:hypothetical protein